MKRILLYFFVSFSLNSVVSQKEKKGLQPTTRLEAMPEQHLRSHAAVAPLFFIAVFHIFCHYVAAAAAGAAPADVATTTVVALLLVFIVVMH